MPSIYRDKYYTRLVNNILETDEFNKIKYIEHHGTTRFDHSLRVSYYSYKIARLLKLDYKEVARGGLLHDFFFSDIERTSKDKFLSTFTHSKQAVDTASQYFKLNDKEVDIIRTHMFPINLAIPKYAESWIVSLVDKGVGTFEFFKQFKYKLMYGTNMYLLFMINIIK